MLAFSTPTAKKAKALAASPSFTLFAAAPPLVRRGAVGDEEDPGAVERDPVLAVDLLSQADELDPGRDGGAHRGVARRLEPRRLEDPAVSNSVTTSTEPPNVMQATSTRFDGQLVGHELVAEGLEARVELGNRRALHRRRHVEEQQAGAARLGVQREVTRSERLLVHGFPLWQGLGGLIELLLPRNQIACPTREWLALV